MGPRGSALICGYTNYHRMLESSLADLKKKEVYSSFLLIIYPILRILSIYYLFIYFLVNG